MGPALAATGTTYAKSTVTFQATTPAGTAGDKQTLGGTVDYVLDDNDLLWKVFLRGRSRSWPFREY